MYKFTLRFFHLPLLCATILINYLSTNIKYLIYTAISSTLQTSVHASFGIFCVSNTIRMVKDKNKRVSKTKRITFRQLYIFLMLLGERGHLLLVQQIEYLHVKHIYLFSTEKENLF